MTERTVAIVDDEIEAINNIRQLLEILCPKFRIVHVNQKPLEALKWLKKNGMPDVLFTDISMPGVTGFDFLELCDVDNCKVVFASAHDDYALKAIDFHPYAFLVKPIDSDKLVEIYNKILNEPLVHERESGRISRTERLSIPTSSGIRFLDLDEVISLKAERSYCSIYLMSGEHLLISKSLSWVLSTWDEENLIKCHKSYAVNHSKISEFHRGNGGFVLMVDGTEIPVSKALKEEFLEKIGFGA